jgi:sulfatase modifying factor 1
MNNAHQNNQSNQQHEHPASPHWQPPERATVTTAGAAVSGTIIMVIITGVFGLITSCKPVLTVTSTPTLMPTLAEPTPVVPTLVFIPALNADDCRAGRIPESACTGLSHNDEWEPYIQDFNGVDVALVPAGCFMMGSDKSDNEKPIHQVCFDEPFWIDVYEVTNEAFGSMGCGRITIYSSDPNQPRNCVNWADSLAHCAERGARLPTEAEWEYAARGRDGLAYPWGDQFVAENAVHSGNSGGLTAPVGSKPDGMSWVGAYDLSGNVWEWVNDWYDPDYYTGSPVNDPQGPQSGTHRVVRGGAFDHPTSFLRSALRRWNPPSNENINFGFRCARDYRP